MWWNPESYRTDACSENGMHVLVTGGAGYIGSHACKLLAAKGYVPVTFDNLIYGHRWAVKWGPFEHGDIKDSVRVNEVFSKYRPVAVMHFAAFAYVGESVGKPSKYYLNNVQGVLCLLEAMRTHGIDQFVFSSTCATYGNPLRLPIDESHPQQPINPYGKSKLMVEQILEDFEHAYGMRSVSLRYFNAAGADPDSEIGELHEPETHLIPIVLDVALGDRSSIDIYGNNYDTPDGTCIRDYIHVMDLADAHLRALEYLEKGGHTTAFNLANGNGFSVQEVIEVARRVTGCPIAVQQMPKRPGDPAALVGDAEHAKKVLDWNPRFHDLDTIIETAWRWRQFGRRE